MHAWFRVDSSLRIGGGHLMRCLALADELRLRGISSSFLCLPLPGNLCAQVSDRGHRLMVLAECSREHCDWSQSLDAQASLKMVRPDPDDWLVVDHYALDQAWETRMRSAFERIFAIDDLADRPHDCDLLLDQNRTPYGRNAYADLTGPNCRCLFGPGYALLAPQFAETRRNLLDFRRGRLNRIMVFFGSSDEENHTDTALQGIDLWGQPVQVDVVIGEANPHRQTIETWCRKHSAARLFVQTNKMAALMAQSDLSIGAAGSTTWERCCLGLPSVAAVCADNQQVVAETSAEFGVAHNIGRMAEVSPEQVLDALLRMTPAMRTEMEQRALHLVDGSGAKHVAGNLLR